MRPLEMNGVQSCARCWFWREPPRGLTVGECRKLTPSVSGWPRTKPTDWCAKWIAGAEWEKEPKA